MLSNHEDIPFTQHTDMHRQDTWSLLQVDWLEREPQQHYLQAQH
jgi:hypothetical protein